MNLKDETAWNEWVQNNQDPYGGACIKVARRVMELLDDGREFDASDIINQADKETNAGGITGFMAGAVAQMVSVCHVRGDEFKQKWNEYWNPADTREGVINPALITIG